MVYDITFTRTVFRATLERMVRNKFGMIINDYSGKPPKEHLRKAALSLSNYTFGEVALTELVNQMDIHLDSEVEILLEKEMNNGT